VALLDRLTSTGPKRLLALDGGGIRGALTLGILRHLETAIRTRHHNPHLRLCDYFDLIGGTSTGSIIATALATGWSVSEISRLYAELGPKVFGRRTWRPWKALYDTEALARGLEDAFGSRKLGDPDIPTGLCIFAKRADTGGTWRFFNHPQGRFFQDNRDILLRQAVRASTAAPIYFAPERIEVGPGQTGTFVDGAVSMAGNPALQLFLVATLNGFPFRWPVGEQRLLLVSVGTGMTRAAHSLGPADASNLWQWAAAVPAMLINDASSQTQLLLQAFSRTRTPWTIDSEIGDLSTDLLSAEPLMTYLRYSAWLEAESLEQLGLHDLIPKLSALRALDVGDAAYDLEQIGDRAGARDVHEHDLPAEFDLPNE